MKSIQLGFKAFDPHELLCHFIAAEAGLYEQAGLRVELVDITFIPETDLPVHFFQASCGAALSSAIRGIPQRILFVATDMPMFWLYSTDNIRNVRELTTGKIATFPVTAPPHHLAGMILNKYGLMENALVLVQARDDVARLGLLKSGDVDAAVISSAMAPPKIEQLGFNKLCFFGDEIRIPTTGLAIDQSFLRAQPQLVNKLVTAMKESLTIIHQDADLVGAVLEEYFDVPAEFRNETAQLYRDFYTHTGTTTKKIAQGAIDSICNSMGLSGSVPWDQIYLFNILDQYN